MRGAIWVVLVSVSLTSLATAQADAADPSATELVDRARRAQDAGRSAEAIDAYARAYQLTGDKSLLFELGQAERRAGHSDEARRLFQTYLRRDPQGAHRDSAEKQIQELERQPAGPVATQHVLLTAAGVALAAPPAPAGAGAANETCATALQTAERLQSQGRLLAARDGLAACLSPACPSQVKVDCERRQASISAAIPAVVLVAKNEASNDVTAVRVAMDGRPLVNQIDSAPISVDPGEHRFVFEAVGFRRMETSVVAKERNKKIRVVVYLNAARTPVAGEPSAVSSAISASDSSSANPTVEPSEQAWGRGWNRKIELGLVGAGVAGIAVGAIWAVRSKSTYDNALSSECDGDPGRCSPQGIADGHTAHQQATVATVGFVAAGVLISAAAAMYLATPKQTSLEVAPSVADRSGGLTVVGKW